MSAVVSAVSSVASSVGKVVSSVGKVAEDVVSKAVDVVEDVGKTVDDAVQATIKAAEDDPLKAIATVAAVATGQVWALPLINGAATLAHGGDLGDAMEAAAISYAAGEVGGAAGNQVMAETGSQAAATAAGGAAGGATGAALSGGDVATGAVAGGINAYGNAQLKGATTNIGGTPEVAPAGPVSSGPAATSTMSSDVGTPPANSDSTDWNAIHNEPSTNPATGETTTPVDQSAYPVQDIQVDPKSSSALYAPGSTGTDSTWQTVGSDRIQVHDDGTATGINTETGETYSLGQDQVTVMEQNGLINNNASGYTGAISGTKKGVTLPVPKINFAAGLMGGAGGAGRTGRAGQNNGSDTSADSSVNPEDMATKLSIASTSTNAPVKKTSEYNQEQLNPLLYKLTFDPPAKSSYSNPFSDVALGTSAFAPSASGAGHADPFESLALETSFVKPQAAQQEQTAAKAPEESSFFAEGGLARMHPMGEPQFYSEGGLGNRYTEGEGDGTSDEIPAMLANNEFVIPADVVSALGNGSSDAGASKLDQMIMQIRKRARSTKPSELPPTAYESPLDYLKGKA